MKERKETAVLINLSLCRIRWSCAAVSLFTTHQTMCVFAACRPVVTAYQPAVNHSAERRENSRNEPFIY